MDKKDVEKRINDIMKMVNKPKYICKKCARTANEKEFICKPVEINI
jgi:hypothetical protein